MLLNIKKVYNKKKITVTKENMGNWKKFGFEFLSIFIAVIAAFALNNWNDNRRDKNTEGKILMEISNGLQKDLDDIRLNKHGHEQGIAACNYFRNAFLGNEVVSDSLLYHYLNLTRDFVSIQNIAGYETLKSKGLEIIANDSLRLQIISLYEYDYNTLRKLEEEYSEMQFQQSYFKEINEELSAHFKFNENGAIIGMHTPMTIPEKTRNKLLTYLWKIQTNRNFILYFYNDIEEKINKVRGNINTEVKR